MKLGILLPIFSLPSKYGVGDFGYEAYEFIDILVQYHIDYWEILPIQSGSSPYSPSSYYALNEYYISLDKLIDMGLLTHVEERPRSSRIHYDDYKEKYYQEAYSHFIKDESYYRFSSNPKMIEFAHYQSKRYHKEEDYYLFQQYILDKQWQELKEYAHQKGVKIIGDLPIYPDFQSCEVANNPEYYELEDGKMKFVSGASPDEFSSEGQKWGHPLYNFAKMKENQYQYLLERYKSFLERFDIIRIDHFRAFDTYYKIPIDKSAKEGFYVEGPGEEFFDALFQWTTWDRFIVEDLGDIRKETEALRDKYHFTKMKIIQYTIDCSCKKDIYEDTENMVIYTGNHDNNTIVGWYNGLTADEQQNLAEFLKENGCFEEQIHLSLIKYCLKSMAHYAIFPVQDIMGLDETARINLPGKESLENWSWELLDFQNFKDSMQDFKRLID